MGDKAADTKHIEALHDLGYLPIPIKAVEEVLINKAKTFYTGIN
ncbi:hypothetical protein [Clostridium sp. YIM B02551]|nr:hypothetical protein [Clostridium sp. YIM B02551]